MHLVQGSLSGLTLTGISHLMYCLVAQLVEHVQSLVLLSMQCLMRSTAQMAV